KTRKTAGKPGARDHILIVVHPGSACGSADMNLGYDEADEARAGLMQELWDWQGPMAVIDGDLSDELTGMRPAHCDLGQALSDALASAKADGHLAQRIRGDDNEAFNQEDAIASLVEEHGWDPRCQRFTVTGAWFHPQDGSGCVGSVRDVLANRGFS